MRNAPPAATDGANGRSFSKYRRVKLLKPGATAVNNLLATQRPIKRKRAPKKPHPREVAVYSGQIYLGTVKVAGKAVAFDSNGKRVGSFTSLQAASDALGGGGRD